jgi:ABC-type Fe3+-siderophore transport system permease subunit
MDESNKIISKKNSASLRLGGLLFVLLLFSLAAALFFGSENLSFFELSDEQRTILFDVRLPRVLLGLATGAR